MDAFCLAFRAGPTRQSSWGESERTFKGGDGLVSSLLIVSLVITVPIVLFIIGLMGNNDYWEIVTHYIGGFLLCGVAVYIYWIVLCYKWIKARRETFAPQHNQFSCKFYVIKLLILFCLCVFSVIDKIQIINEDIENHNKYQAYTEMSIFSVFTIIQTVFFFIAALSSIVYKTEITFEKTLKLSVSYSINVLCNVAIGTYIFWKELCAFRETKHETNIGSLMFTMDLENSLFCIALLSDLLYEETKNLNINSSMALDPFLSSSGNILHSDSFANRGTTDQSSPLLYKPKSKVSCRKFWMKFAFGLVSFWAMFIILGAILCFANRKLCLIHEFHLALVANAFSLIIIYLGYFYIRSFRQKVLPSLTASEIFLLLSSIIFSAFWVFAAVPVVKGVEEGITYYLLYLVEILMSIAEVFCQTTFIVNVRRARQKRGNTDQSPKRLLQMLAILNFALWLCACISLSDHGDQQSAYAKFYRRNAFILCHTFFSVGIFYRFHSFALLMELSERI